jgi:tetratricopeptide (TPR) repeat protein
LARSTQIGNDEARAEQLANLGNVQFVVGRYAEASRRYDEALAVTSAAAGQPWTTRRLRLILVNRATLYQRIGRDQEALAIYSKLGADDGSLSPREHAEVQTNLGVLYRRLGDPIKALRMYDEARDLFSRERAVAGELGALNNRGIVLALDLGRLDDAEQSFSAALEGATRVGNRRTMLLARLYRGETQWRAGRSDRAREDFDAGLALARDLRLPEEEWKALYGLGRVDPDDERAIHYLEEAVRTIEAIREGIRIQSLRSDFLADKRVVYDALIRARLQTAPPGALFDLLERSHSRVWRDRLGLGTAVDLASVQRTLPERMLLLDYWQGPQGAAVIAVSRHRAAVIPLDVDERQITTLIDAMAAGPSSHWRDLAVAVAPRVLPPADWFDAIDHVAIVPDGALALVPFEALPVAGRLLVERVAVSYTPTAATLLRAPSHTRGWVFPWKVQTRIFADPVFSSADLDTAGPPQGRLAASADEARQVASELAGHADVHLGPDSRKAYLFATTAPPPLLHLATHAVADAGAVEQSRILFSPAAGSGASADYLFLKEAYGLPLGGVELAVLSACDTDRGRVVGGEGVQSFSRAFLAAGARSTVTTMWRVADRPSATFMQIFYHHLQRGVPRDEALRRAKLRFIEPGSDLADPHYWAAFVLTGDALRPIPRAISWTAVTATTAGFLALALLPFRLYRASRRAGAPAY